MGLRDILKKLITGTPKAVWTLPTTAAQIGDYRDNFEQACAFTEECGFKVGKPVWLDGDKLHPDGSFLDPILHSAGVKDATKSAGQCLKWSHYLAPAFESKLGCKVWLTIGQIWTKESPVFHPSWDDLRRWRQKGIQTEDFAGRIGLNLHAWLTLETGEIIEPTLLSSMAATCGGHYEAYNGAVAWGRDPNVLNRRYFPMAVGQAFVEEVARRSAVPLLATNPAELHSITMVLVPETMTGTVR